MEDQNNKCSQTVTALLLAAAILLATILMAWRVQDSALYRQSTVIRSIFSQESVGMGELLGQRKNIQMLAKFVGAVTTAYINFELIPVNEAATFAAVFQSVGEDITVDRFEYQRRNLEIDGTALSVEGYQRFVESLRVQNHFDSVSGDYYITTDDTVRFTVICAASTTAHQQAV